MRERFVRGFVVLGIIACATFADAAGEKFETLRVGDDVYTHVLVTDVTATDLYFKHSRGVTNVKLKKLSPELQKQFGFQPEKAAEKEQQQRIANAAYAEKLAKEPPPQRPVESEPEPEPPAKTAVREIASGPWTHKPAPSFVVEKWLTTEPNRQGKFVLIDFWATWCGPCRQSIPHLNQWHQKYGDKLAIIGISNESEAAVRRMTAPKIDYALAIDPGARMAGTVGVRAIPHILIIDPNGIVRYQGHPLSIDEQVLESIFAQFGS